MAACRRHGAPLLSRGGGTSLAGQCCNVAVVMDFSKYMYEVLEIDPEREAGPRAAGRGARLPARCRREIPPDVRPRSGHPHHCTLGGMVGNNSCGIHAQMAGRTADNIHELEILTYDGCRMRVGKTSDEELEAIIRAGRPARRDLRRAEGRCATATPTGSASAFRAFRGAFPATTSMNCCRRTDSTWRARWWARKAPA